MPCTRKQQPQLAENVSRAAAAQPLLNESSPLQKSPLARQRLYKKQNMINGRRSTIGETMFERVQPLQNNGALL